MVLKELLSLWHDESALNEIFRRFDEMIVSAKEMFSLSTTFLIKDDNPDGTGKMLSKMDGKLNTLQQVIRRDTITHISVQGTGDMVPCLMLISIIKDAERIGDYCKNIHEVARKASNINDDPLFPDLVEMRAKILIWFDQTKRSFDRQDRDLAKNTREEAYLHEKSCDRMLWELASDNKGRNAVAAALMLRFFKRVAAHLGNICSSVVQPLDKIDYYKLSDQSEE